MTFNFVPDEKNQPKISAPHFEDARADYAPGYATTKSVETLKTEVLTIMVQLGASGILFREGHFPDKPRNRYGYVVEFQYGHSPARMQVAGLPIWKETPRKKEQVLAHALYNLRDWLKAALTARVFAPGNDVLLQYLLVDGKQTLHEALVAGWRLPSTNPELSSGEIMEAEIVS